MRSLTLHPILFSQDGNNFRREWDKEAFEARAKARLAAELEAEREEKKTEPGVIVQRAPLQRRTEDLQIAKYVGTRQVITGEEALNGAGAYYCKVCECHLRDSANYLAHINGKKHNRMLGMSMRAERSTLGEVRARLEAHKQDEAVQEMSKEEKAADATLMTCIAEMELLTKQMEGISEQTIAEILEQEPEMRKEIEEELENNVWAP